MIFFQKLMAGGDDRELTPGLYPFAEKLASFYTDDTIELTIQELYGQLAAAYDVLYHGEPGFEKTKTCPTDIQR